MNDLIINTSIGGIKVTNHIDFFQNVPKQFIQTDEVIIKVPDKGEPLFLREHESVSEEIRGSNIQRLKLTHEVRRQFSPKEIMDFRLNHYSGAYPGSSEFDRASEIAKYALEDKFVAMMNEAFKPQIAKKKPTFLTKDLTLDKIHELSMEHLNNYSTGKMVAFPYDLSQYQKFFVMADHEAFRFYATQPYLYRDMMCAGTSAVLKARFHEVDPRKWVIGRYEELTYLKEIQDYSRYMVTPSKD